MKKTNLNICLVIFSMVLTGCGSEPTPKKPKSNYVARCPIESVEFEEPVSLYTANQKAFIDYQGDYGTLTAAQLREMGAPSTAENSKPVPVTLTWTHEEDEEFDKYEIAFSLDEKCYEAEYFYVEPQGEKEQKTFEIWNLDFDTTYYYTITGLYKDGSTPDFQDDDHDGKADVHSFTTDKGTIRNYYVDGMTNFRDIGGKELSRGGHIAYGKVFRSSAFTGISQNGLSDITEKGKEVIKDLGIIAEIDLNGPSADTSIIPQQKASFGGEQITYYDCRMNYSGSKDQMNRNTEPIVRVFDVLGDEKNYPLDFHCRIGTDRTGTVALIIEALLGVSEREIFQDYLFSNFGSIQGNGGTPRTVGQTNEDGMGKYYDILSSFYGETLADKTYNWLRTIGVSSEKLDTVIRVLKEGGDEYVSNNKVVDATLSSSVTKTVNSKNDLRQPKEYYRLSSGNKVTATFNIENDGEYEIFVRMSTKAVSSTLPSQLSVTKEGFVANLPLISLSSTSVGFESNGDYWIPINVLSSVEWAKGSHTIELEAIGSDLGISSVTAIQTKIVANLPFI